MIEHMFPGHTADAFEKSCWHLTLATGYATGLGAVLAAMLGTLLITGWLHAGLLEFTHLEHVAGERYGPDAAKRVRDWKSVLERATADDERRQLRQVNDFFNRNIRYMTDLELWAQRDYWATPLETLGMGAGDCEDYAIAKYASLRKLGIPDARLRLFYVHARLGARASNATEVHMVLGYYPAEDEEPLILDNLISDIRPASRRTDLKPVFSFNSQGLWADGATTSAGDSTARLSNWRSVLERMQNDGLNLNRPMTPNH
jgi:predicted transglutaminase-like cysteine proteinase